MNRKLIPIAIGATHLPIKEQEDERSVATKMPWILRLRSVPKLATQSTNYKELIKLL
ncbi:MAG: hypothetical protein WDN26_18350 [Chitinophagaceae bacterium]